MKSLASPKSSHSHKSSRADDLTEPQSLSWAQKQAMTAFSLREEAELALYLL
jgi:hypothetical protein